MIYRLKITNYDYNDVYSSLDSNLNRLNFKMQTDERED